VSLPLGASEAAKILLFLEAAWIYLTRFDAPLDFGIGLGDDSQFFVIPTLIYPNLPVQF